MNKPRPEDVALAIAKIEEAYNALDVARIAERTASAARYAAEEAARAAEDRLLVMFAAHGTIHDALHKVDRGFSEKLRKYADDHKPAVRIR